MMAGRRQRGFAPPLTVSGLAPHLREQPSSPAACAAPRSPSPPPSPPPPRSVYRVRQPLAGLPAWTPALHAGVALAGGGRGDALLLDMLPARATDARVLVEMLRGGRVEARVRLRTARWPLARRGYVLGARVGDTRRSDAELRAFADREARKPASLLGNNCFAFQTALLQFLLAAD